VGAVLGDAAAEGGWELEIMEFVLETADAVGANFRVM